MQDFDGVPRTWAQLRWAVTADLARYTDRRGALATLLTMLSRPGFSYTTWMRTAGLLRRRRALRPLYAVAKLVLLRLRHRWHIAIPEYTKVGPGLKIDRWQSIMVHHDAVIGAGVTLCPYTVLGYMNRGDREGSPTLGDGVYLADGAKVIGKVRVGDSATVLFNSLVTRDVAARDVVEGVPAKPVADERRELLPA